MSNLILREEKGSPLTHNELDQNLINLLLPAGVITSFGGINIPEGWLKCDGSLILRTEYIRLFNAIGELYGSGDGTTTFKLPDLRGEFIRGFDDGRGVDDDREMGSWQNHQFQNHNHSVSWNNHSYYRAQSSPSGQTAGTGSGGWHRFTSLGISVGNPNSGNRGDETRSRNIALHYIIKY